MEIPVNLMKEEKIAELRKLLDPILKQHKVYLVEMELRGQPNNQVLSVYLDTEAGITLQEIADITREFEGILDLEDPIPGKYRLDISSPGIDRPLTEDWQFKKNIGQNLQITLEVEGKLFQKTGTLESIENDVLILADKSQRISIDRGQIRKAIVKLKW
jgi:ribosome maturation factor RimP